VARDNSAMVRAAVAIAAIYGLKPATVDEARARFRI
jgi:3-keto-5-aminohexanoate cleavage enzyme